MIKLPQLKIDARNGGWPWPIVHPNDERALLDGCYLDFAAAERVREFFLSLLCIPKPGGGTQPFELLEWWYRDVLAPLFGWKRPDGRRRYDKGFITTGKKSAKSTVLSGLPIYMITADGEPEAEAYAAATTRDQATILYTKASRMVKQSPDLSRVLKRVDSQKRIVHHASGSWFHALASDVGTAEGKNPHLLIADELHVWKRRQFFNELMYGDIQRSQPMFLMITTAGDDKESIGHEEYQFAKDLLSTDDPFYSMSHFAFIAEAAEGREWDDPEGWKEANPSIGLPQMPTIEKLQAKCDEVRQSPRKRRDFERYIVNRWVDVADDPWLDGDAWIECGAAVPDRTGWECWGGLDLSRVEDLTSLALAFRDGDTMDVLWWFWTPAASVKKHELNWKVPLRDWVRDGWVIATPGATIGYEYIRKLVSGVVTNADGSISDERFDGCLADKYDIQHIAFDRWGANEIKHNLGEVDGIALVDHGQGYKDMSPAAKAFAKKVNDRQLRHGNNPVANWMRRHAVVDEDPAENIKPNKLKSRHKIDGIVAAVMAVGRATDESTNNVFRGHAYVV